MLLTFTFWALFLLPGYACVQRYARLLCTAGWLSALAYGYAASFVLLSPVSLLCYAFGAPLFVFSGALVAAVGVALVWLLCSGAPRELLRQLRSEPVLPYLALGALLVLQVRCGGWLDGDATFHLGRIRVLIEHGFTNRDIYLSQYHFQHAYHSNLLYPVYASLAQLTGTSYLTTWFYSEGWAKLLIAAAHYVFGQTLTQRRYVGFLLAACVITLNAGETYSLYPNTLGVGFVLPMLIALGCRCLRRDEPSLATIVPVAGLVLLAAQIHALYAVYAVLVVGPVIGLALVRARLRRERPRWRVWAALLSLGLSLPFVLVSNFGYRSEQPVATAPDDQLDPVVVPPAPGVVRVGAPRVAQAPALAAGGGHLEKVLDEPTGGVMVFKPERMGGRAFVIAGFACLLFALAIGAGQRAELAGALFSASLLAAMLFTPRGVGVLRQLLQSSFVVARMSTVLTTLLVFGMCASLGWLAQRPRRGRRLLETVLFAGALGLATRALGHAPISFAEHVRAALAPGDTRHVLLDRLNERRNMLNALPPGVTVLTTARFGRQVVMLRDCYLLAADRGHTYLSGIDKRRRDLVIMNAADTPWELRARLIRHYDLRWVTFERRWRRRYQWAYEHGTLRASAAGQDLIELRDEY